LNQKEVTAMTTALSNHQSLSRQASRVATHRPAVDILVERAARSMLAWSERRARTSMVGADRIALLVENQRAAERGGSAIGR
jgi:hypothetical protein